MALKYLRDNLKSLKWVLWGVVAVFVMLVFFEWGGVNDRQMARNLVAATVGDETISYREFQNQYRNLEARYRQTFGEQFNREMAQRFNLPVQALDSLINQRILLMEARRIGLTATDSEVRDAILEFPAFQDESGQFIGSERYQEILKRSRTSSDEFEAEIREGVLLQKLDNILAQTAYISDAEVERIYREEAEKAEIRYVQLPASQFVSEVVADASEIQAHFEENPTDYELPEQRIADYIMVDTVQLRREIEIPDADLQAYYDANAEEFTREEQVRARHILLRVTPSRPAEQAESELESIRARIEGGEDFAALAAEFSDDESNAERGGDLGFFGRDRMVKPFSDAAFAAQVGEIVGPVKTDFGYHLIEVQERRPGGQQPFEQVQGVVKSRLVGERVEEIAEAKIRDLSQRITTEGLTSTEQLTALAEEEGLTVRTTEAFDANGTVASIGRAPDFNSAAFGLQNGEISEPVKVPRGWVIAQLKEVLPPRIPELAEVEARVKAAVEEKKRKEFAVGRLAEMRTAIEEGGDFEALVSEVGLEIQESGEFGRLGNIAGLGANSDVADAALALEEGDWGGPVESALGAVLFQVTSRKSFDPDEFSREKASTRSRQESERLNEVRASLIELRRRDLTPQYGTQVLADFEIEQPSAG